MKKGSARPLAVFLLILLLSLTILVILLLLFRSRLRPTAPKNPPGLVSLPATSVNPLLAATAAASLTQIEINYTAAGFTPAKVTIKKGTVIVFYNKSKGPMRIKSDLPGFNQTIEGNTYAYTFNGAGKWTFQNQKQPSDSGTIAVMP